MKLEIMAVGKLRDKHYRALFNEYFGRLGHYLPCAHTEIKASRASGADALAEEADVFRARTRTHTVRVAMDERGPPRTSTELAEICQEWMLRGTRHVAFYIGSAEGLDATFRQECDLVLSLSTMTLPHEMARVLLAEQLYRAQTIIRGEPYHK